MKKQIMFIFLSLFIFSGHSQIDLRLPEIVPNSPETTQFIDHSNKSVNMYTGAPDISIPIHSIQGSEIGSNISLSYNASGVKVDQIASSVGLGWNLNYGGVLSRNIKGLPDRASASYYKIYSQYVRDIYDIFDGNGMSLSVFNSLSDLNKIRQMIDNYEIAEVDLEADTFSFNVNGISGEIAIDYSSIVNGKYKVFCLDNPTFKINYELQNEEVSLWRVTDQNGVTYTFGQPERTQKGYTTLENEYVNNYYSAWYLTSIKNANETEEISFGYENESFWTNSQPIFKNEVLESIINPCNEIESNYNVNLDNDGYRIKQFNLKEIKYNGRTQIALLASVNDRLDLAGKKAINKLFIQDHLGNYIKTYEFMYDYFHSEAPLAAIDELNHRLKLKELRIYPKQDYTSKFQTYSFDYLETGNLPNRVSASRDYWGYYNGSSHNTMLANNTDVRDNLQTLSWSRDFNGSDRRANAEKTKYWTLETITYPTGGMSKYYYRNHMSQPYTVIEEIETPLSFSFQGGDDASITPNEYFSDENGTYCDDISAGEVPKTLVVNFEIEDTNGNTYFNINKQGSQPIGNENNSLFYGELFIYRAFAPLTYCELKSMRERNDSNLINIPVQLYRNIHDMEFSLNLTPGKYFVHMYSSDPNCLVDLEVGLPPKAQEFTRKDKIGGLQCYKIESFDDINTSQNPTNVRLFYYGDFSRQIPNPDISISDINIDVTETLITSQNDNSGIQHQKLLFNKYVKESKMGECVGGSEDRQEQIKFQVHGYNLAPQARYNVAYSRVSEILFKEGDFQGFMVTNFYNVDKGQYYHNVPIKSSMLNGKIVGVKNYNSENRLLREISNEYNVELLNDTVQPYYGIVFRNNITHLNMCQTHNVHNGEYNLSYVDPNGTGDCDNASGSGSFPKNQKDYFPNRYRRYQQWFTNIKTIQKDFYKNHSSDITEKIESSTRYFYENDIHKQRTRIDKVNSKGDTLRTKLRYANDVNNLLLINQNKIATPIEVTESKIFLDTSEEEILSKRKVKYIDWSLNAFGTQNIILPEIIQASKGSNVLENRIIYDNYDAYGNPTELSKEDDTHLVYIWGYNQEYPIAKIENATYAQVETAISSLNSNYNTLAKIQGLSNTDIDATTELALETALNDLRTNLPSSMVTTYTYDPLIGVTSMTDPRGYTMYYEYDEFNRLKQVKDSARNIVSKTEYNYKDQE